MSAPPINTSDVPSAVADTIIQRYLSIADRAVNRLVDGADIGGGHGRSPASRGHGRGSYFAGRGGTMATGRPDRQRWRASSYRPDDRNRGDAPSRGLTYVRNGRGRARDNGGGRRARSRERREGRSLSHDSGGSRSLRASTLLPAADNATDTAAATTDVVQNAVASTSQAIVHGPARADDDAYEQASISFDSEDENQDGEGSEEVQDEMDVDGDNAVVDPGRRH
ncbi:hypothetical protein FA95DRAFT_1578239, partial [Auriscalpium vulgare]